MSTTVEPVPVTGPRANETRTLPEIGGIEITGIDLSQAFSQERKDWLMRTFRAHPVIVFRDQHLTKEQQYEFTLTFGEIEGAHVNRLIDPVKYTPVHTVSNIGSDGKPSAPESEGHALLRWLESFATQAAFVYSHRWQPGDLVLWDNRCTLHRALPHEDMDKERRVLHRTVVKGTVPY